MKNIILIALAFLSVTYISCDDDDNGSISDSSIVGKWQLFSVVFNGEDKNISDCRKKTTIEIGVSTIKLVNFDIEDGEFINGEYVEGKECVSSFDEISYRVDDNEIITFENGQENRAKFVVNNEKLIFTLSSEDQMNNKTVVDISIVTYKRL